MRSLLLLVLCALTARAADGMALLELKDLAQAVVAEMRAGKADTVVAHGHPAWVNELGGPKKARQVFPAMLARELEGLKAKGFPVVAYTAGEPRVLRETARYTFALIPMTTVAEGEKGTITGRSHWLAIKNEARKGRWRLINLGEDEAEMRKLVPELPKDVTLPAPTKAAFTPR